MGVFRTTVVLVGAVLLIGLLVTWKHESAPYDLVSEYTLAEDEIGKPAANTGNGWSPFASVDDQRILNNLDAAPAWVKEDYGYHESDDSSPPPAPAWVRDDLTDSPDSKNVADTGSRQSQIVQAEEAALHWAGHSRTLNAGKISDADKTHQYFKQARLDEKRRWAKTLFSKHFLKIHDPIKLQRPRGESKTPSNPEDSQTANVGLAEPLQTWSESKDGTTNDVGRGNAELGDSGTTKSGAELAEYQNSVTEAQQEEAARAEAMERLIQDQRAQDRLQETVRDSEILHHVQHPARPHPKVTAARRIDGVDSVPDPVNGEDAVGTRWRNVRAAGAGPDAAAAEPRARPRPADDARRAGTDEEQMSEENARLVKAQSSLLDLLAASEARCADRCCARLDGSDSGCMAPKTGSLRTR